MHVGSSYLYHIEERLDTMAYAALNSLAMTLEQYLQNPDPYSNIHVEKRLLESLLGKIEFLLVFLKDSSDKSNERIACLEKRIRDAAYEAEDIIDLQLTNQSPSTRCTSFWIKAINCLLPLFAGLKKDVPELESYEKEMKLRKYVLNLENEDMRIMAEEFDSITEEVEKFRDEMGSNVTEELADSAMEHVPKIDKFGLYDLQSRSSLRAGGSKHAPDPYNLVVGISDDLMQIKNHLTEESSKLQVISIVGMGGIGKTTLVTSVYNDPYIMYHFDMRAWVTVSQSYHTRNILLGILGSITSLTDNVYEERDDQLGDRLYKTLIGTRYLIVIDDIWDIHAWEQVKRIFPDDNAGSRIILTTRLAEIAEYASSSGPIHQMSLLDEEKSWNLLHAKVFGEQPCPWELRGIGEKIALKCKGLPLSLVVIGGILSKTNMTQGAWGEVVWNVTSIVTSSDQCLEILKLSYNYLPQHLKACFLYLGVFPEDHGILASQLTKLWVAEGFIKQDPSGSLEVAAERCLEELVKRGMVLVSKHNSQGKIKLCRVHDLLRDICVTQANKEKFLHVTEWYVNIFPEGSFSQRRISIHRNNMSDYLFRSTPSIAFNRSLIFIGQNHTSSSVFSNFKLLRVLDAIKVDFYLFPSEILQLSNLRYLALSMSSKRHIPASISKLWNLQTLIICQELDTLWFKDIPMEIWKMQHLRHVEIANACFLDPVGAQFDIDEKLANLSFLHTLAGIMNLRFNENMWKRIRNVEKLVVSYVPSVFLGEGWAECHFENMLNLHHLKTLKFRIYPSAFFISSFPALKLKLAFPQTLKMLTLSGCAMAWHDLTVVGSLPHLEVLKLRDHACWGPEWEPNEGEFCRLKHLVLEGTNLKHWKADNESFPHLERLILRMCYELVEIPCGMGESPTLTVIELFDCKDSAVTSARQILEMQQSLGNDGFQFVVHSKWKDKDSMRFLAPKFYQYYNKRRS
ncbi:putative late blight resistance protein homolog R1A-3 [Henckelia pumila]|uniref:putative late blight resistance protein homolog R1A-3 n=1 Tax=Henckelia pumila TaxID=405737 RepID=UPI003C6DDD0B